MERSAGWAPAAIRNLVPPILAKHGIRILGVDRQGPRFTAARALYHRRKAVLKICNKPNDAFSRERLLREARWFHFVDHSKHLALRRLLPDYFTHGEQPVAWYVRAYVTGLSYDVGDGHAFKPSFFTTRVLRELETALHDLHRVRASELPVALRRVFVRYDTVADKLRFIRGQAAILRRSLGRAKYAQSIQWLRQRAQGYDSSPSVLAHHEMFSGHFFRMHGRLQVIDWESVTWANPVRDWVTIWMQAHEHPVWQQALRRAARRETTSWLPKTFDEIWDTAIFFNALYVLIAAADTKKTPSMRGLQRFARQLVETQLSLVTAPK